MNFDELITRSAKYGRQTHPREAIELYNSVLNTPAGDVLEIGSASGGTTLFLIEAAKRAGKVVYSVDPYPQDIEGDALYYTEGLMNRFQREFKENILTGEHDNIIQFNEYLKDCIHKIPALSVVFIDGCHELIEVQNEYDLIYPLVVSGGVICFHDMQWELGQKSKNKDGGLSNVPAWIGKGEIIETMLKIVK